MNELHDDPHLRHLELNRINALLDKSLDYAWELSHSGNREKHEITIDKDKDMYVNRYADIINDKLDVVNEIGELIDSYMADAYNIVDGINESHNNSSAYDILAEDLKKCKDTILKMINSFNVCAKQDTKKNDADNVNVCDKQDTNDDDDDDIDIDKFYNLNDKVSANLNIVFKTEKEFSTNSKKIIALVNEVANTSKNDLGLKFDIYKELNILAEYLYFIYAQPFMVTKE